ncbi:MAG: hypothetical protein LBQ54_06405 [Planctomycetaceae bacterium]|jgi:hypothetical protein|nr:hypothetical protein [Planctomycetaceae bacterium]
MKKLLFMVAVTAVVAFGSGMVFADISSEISNILNNFNSKNNGKGTLLTYSTANNNYGYEVKLTAPSGSAPSLAAYTGHNTASGTAFSTFCIEGHEPVSTAVSQYGRLNYNTNGTTQTSIGNVVTNGVAWLYQQFATGQLSNFAYTGANRDADFVELQNAMYIMIGENHSGLTAGNNKYVSQMLASNTVDYWLQNYQVGSNVNGDTDGYAVFAVQMQQSNGSSMQDFLYLAKVSNNPAETVPEPAALLFWTFGSLGVMGVSVFRKKRRGTDIAV